jgi:hypothetical protein
MRICWLFGFESAAFVITLSFSRFDPTLAFAGILASTAGSRRSTGTLAFTAVYAHTFTRFMSSSRSIHWSNSEHCSSGCGQSDARDFLCSNHLVFLIKIQ